MSKAGYAITTGAAVALAAATAKSILGAKAGSACGLDWVGFSLSFDGTAATAVPVLYELCYATFATNSPGTASTSVTPAQQYGRVITASFTGARNWTTEPTSLTVIKEDLLTPAGGYVDIMFPLGQTPDSAVSQGFVIRCTAPAVVNVRGEMRFEGMSA